MVFVPIMDRLDRSSDNQLKLTQELNIALDKVQSISVKQEALSIILTNAASAMQDSIDKGIK